jgi:hypothetical protein
MADLISRACYLVLTPIHGGSHLLRQVNGHPALTRALTLTLTLPLPLPLPGFNPARDIGPRIVASLAGWGTHAFKGWWAY